MEELFPYQKFGADWLSSRKHALLADEMGLGKTAQVITAADISGLSKILVIAPAVARVNWLREFNQWSIFPRDFQILSKMKDWPRAGRSVICSFEYASTHPERLRFGMEKQWDLLVIDEVHFLKSVDAKRTQNVFGQNGIVHAAKRVWVLSGTPAPNHAGELWVILRVFGVTELSYDAFLKRYCNVFMFGNRLRISGTKKSAVPELRALLSKVMLRRRKMEVLKELPPIHFTDIVVEPGFVDIDILPSFVDYLYPRDRRHELHEKLQKERATLEAVVDLEATGVDKIKMLEGMAASVSTLRRYSGIQKVQAVVDLVKSEIEAGLYEKIVIFAIHQDVIEGLRVGLTKYGAVTLYGGTPPEKRQRHIDKFQKTKKTRVFIGNIAAAGTNITLTAAHHVLFVEQDWVPGNNAQAAMRVHRIGQKESVTVRFVSLNNPMDERITQILKRKTKELAEIFDE